MKALFVLPTLILCFCAAAFAQTPASDSAEGDFPDWITSQYAPYSGKDKIDPFVSFIKIREYELMQAAKKAKQEKKATTPLETVDVHSLKLIGILEKGEGVSPGHGRTARRQELSHPSGHDHRTV